MMSFVLACSRWSAAVLLLAWTVTPAPAAGVSTDPDSRGKDGNSAEKISKALDQALTYEFNNQPLAEAISYFHDHSKIHFVLDRLTLQQMGITPEETMVTAKLENVKLRKGLRSVLGQYNLGYAVIGDSVLISSEEMVIFRQMRQRISLDLDKVQLDAALKKLARETATNLVLDTRVAKESQSAVTLKLEDVPLEVGVRLMADMAGLKPVRIGNVLYVTTKTNAVELRSDPDNSTPPTPPAPRNGEDVPAIGIPAVVPAPAALPQAAPPAPAAAPKPAAPAPAAPADAEKKADAPADKKP